jgi:hypothetical protein
VYYKEEYINGRWHYRTSPHGDWHELSVSALTEKANELQCLRDTIINALTEDLSDGQKLDVVCKALRL